MQSKEYVNLLNYTVTRWNAQHDEELHMHYWQWQEGKYPQIAQDAKWHPAITIQFNSNGGEVVYSKYAVAGSIVLPPRRPAKEGYLFAGWYKDAECKQFFDFANDTITQDITLYARWIEDTRFDIDITPFQNEFATTYRIRTAAQLRGLIAMNDGWWDWGEKVECSTGYSNTHTASYPNQALSQVYTPMDFEGKKVVLENDIFLCDTTDWQYWGRGAYGVPWKPIGNAHGANAGEGSHPFKGTFDGQGLTIYGMFIAIVMPKVKTERKTALCVALSIILSCIFYFVPGLNKIPSGFAIIICAATASILFSFIAPISVVTEEDEDA